MIRSPYRPRALHLLGLFLILGLPGLTSAAVVEEVMEVPVSVKTLAGQEVNQTITVTVFRDDTREKSPYLVLNHGRPANPAEFAKMKRQRYSENSRYFVSRGFVVLVPTRVGYGDTAGIDVEYTGRCDNRNFAPANTAIADQTATVLKFAANLPYVDLSRGIVAGQSFGGMAAIALSTRKLPGLLGAVNFSGGGGGNPIDRPGDPCSSARLKALYRSYGAMAKVPSLWLYSENDLFWGAELPREWFSAFVEAGGKARFIQLPPYKDNGHGIFSANPHSWKPAFEDFLKEIGLSGTDPAQGASATEHTEHQADETFAKSRRKTDTSTPISMQVKFAESKGGKSKETFPPDTRKIFALFKSQGTRKGDVVRCVFFRGKEKIADLSLPASPIDDIYGTCSISADGDSAFSSGKYHLDIYANSLRVARAKFEIADDEDEDDDS